MEGKGPRPDIFLGEASNRTLLSKAVPSRKTSVAPYRPHGKYDHMGLAYEPLSTRSSQQATSIFSQEKEKPTPGILASLAGPPSPMPPEIVCAPHFCCAL